MTPVPPRGDLCRHEVTRTGTLRDFRTRFMPRLPATLRSAILAHTIAGRAVGKVLRSNVLQLCAGLRPQQWRIAGNCQQRDELIKTGVQRLSQHAMPAKLVFNGVQDGPATEQEESANRWVW
jgi:hypothetical protein